MGEDLALLDEPVGMEGLEGVADAPVQLLPPVGPERVVRHLLSQGMLERVRQLREHGLFANQIDGQQLGEGLLARRCRASEPIDDALRKLSSDHGGDVEHLPSACVQPVDPRTEHVLHRVGQGEIAEVCRQQQTAALPADHPRLLA